MPPGQQPRKTFCVGCLHISYFYPTTPAHPASPPIIHPRGTKLRSQTTKQRNPNTREQKEVNKRSAPASGYERTRQKQTKQRRRIQYTRKSFNKSTTQEGHTQRNHKRGNTQREKILKRRRWGNIIKVQINRSGQDNTNINTDVPNQPGQVKTTLIVIDKFPSLVFFP